MSSLSRISNSFVSASNENTLALANFNFDFSLVKFEAPQEFAPLGSALSLTRKKNAEDGTVHQLARKLGALFEQMVPSTPNLIRAYGARASEIIQAPGINPKGSKADGPFQNYVGADATSVWAAATSGPASLAVLLLASILARIFDDAKITEIRPELTLLRSQGDAALSRVSSGSPWSRVSQSCPLLGLLGPVDSALHCQHSACDWRCRVFELSPQVRQRFS